MKPCYGFDKNLMIKKSSLLQYLPVAQRLIDQLREPSSEINAAVGAPDPTDGGHEEIAIWCLDQEMLHENIRRILDRFTTPSPTVHWYLIA